MAVYWRVQFESGNCCFVDFINDVCFPGKAGIQQSTQVKQQEQHGGDAGARSGAVALDAAQRSRRALDAAAGGRVRRRGGGGGGAARGQGRRGALPLAGGGLRAPGRRPLDQRAPGARAAAHGDERRVRRVRAGHAAGADAGGASVRVGRAEQAGCLRPGTGLRGRAAPRRARRARAAPHARRPHSPAGLAAAARSPGRERAGPAERRAGGQPRGGVRAPLAQHAAHAACACARRRHQRDRGGGAAAARRARRRHARAVRGGRAESLRLPAGRTGRGGGHAGGGRGHGAAGGEGRHTGARLGRGARRVPAADGAAADVGGAVRVRGGGGGADGSAAALARAGVAGLPAGPSARAAAAAVCALPLRPFALHAPVAVSQARLALLAHRRRAGGGDGDAVGARRAARGPVRPAAQGELAGGRRRHGGARGRRGEGGGEAQDGGDERDGGVGGAARGARLGVELRRLGRLAHHGRRVGRPTARGGGRAGGRDGRPVRRRAGAGRADERGDGRRGHHARPAAGDAAHRHGRVHAARGRGAAAGHRLGHGRAGVGRQHPGLRLRRRRRHALLPARRGQQASETRLVRASEKQPIFEAQKIFKL